MADTKGVITWGAIMILPLLTALEHLLSLPLSRRDQKNGITISETLRELTQRLTEKTSVHWTQSECIMETIRHCLGVHQNNLSTRLDLLAMPRNPPKPQSPKVKSKLQSIVDAVKRAADKEERENDDREAQRLAVEKAKWDQLQEDHRNSLAEATAKVGADQARLAQLQLEAVAEDIETTRLRLNFDSDSPHEGSDGGRVEDSAPASSERKKRKTNRFGNTSGKVGVYKKKRSMPVEPARLPDGSSRPVVVEDERPKSARAKYIQVRAGELRAIVEHHPQQAHAHAHARVRRRP